MNNEPLEEILSSIGSRSGAPLEVTIVTGTQYRDCRFIQYAMPATTPAAAAAEAAAEAEEEAEADASDRDEQVAAAIYAVMERKDEYGNYLFAYCTQWQSIYRVLVDRHVVARKDYTGFCAYVDSICPEPLRIAADCKSLSKTDDGILSRPLKEWNRASYDGTATVYLRYERVAKLFLSLLPPE